MSEPVQISHCRSCGAEITWAQTKNNRLAPYDVVDGQPTETNHFATCPQRDQWRKRTTK